jgi:hypothetical protein
MSSWSYCFNINKNVTIGEVCISDFVHSMEKITYPKVGTKLGKKTW